MAEAIVFAYVGVVFAPKLYHSPIAWKLVVALFFVVIIGRFLAVYFAYFIFSCRCCPGSKKNNLSFA